MRNLLAQIVSLLCMFVLVSCAALKGAEPVNPAKVASDARKASVDACNALDAAVAAKLVKSSPEADKACAAVRGLCSDK